MRTVTSVIIADDGIHAREFLADLATGHNVIASVAVPACSHHGVHGSAGETMFAQSRAGASRHLQRHYGWSDMHAGDALIGLLEVHRQASPRLRGIRHSAAWDTAVAFHTLVASPAWAILAIPALYSRFGL